MTLLRDVEDDDLVVVASNGGADRAPAWLHNVRASRRWRFRSAASGAPDLEFRLATEALELDQSGLGYQRVPPGYRFPYGHTHKRQEEVYVVVRGSGRMKLDDEIVAVPLRARPGRSSRAPRTRRPAPCR